MPTTILDKPGKLTATECERLRLNSYYTERVLAHPAALARIGAVAALAYERMDGSGAHRRLSGPSIPVAARILGAGDSYQAMTEPRPHRKINHVAGNPVQLRAAQRISSTFIRSMASARSSGIPIRQRHYLVLYSTV